VAPHRPYRTIATLGVLRRSHSRLTSAVIGLADKLGLGTVAEGVEDHQQLDWLLQADCGSAQGCLLARPISADELATMLHQGTLTPAGSLTAAASSPS
jgi:diguanylate cyclase